MNVFKIPDNLERDYKGAGLALSATSNGQLVAIRYLSDAAPDFDGGPHELQPLIESGALAATVRELQSLGQVHIGMLSGWEFIEL